MSHLLKRYYILFLSSCIFFPKLDLFIGNFYLFEVINLFIFFSLFFLPKLPIKSPIIITYALFSILCGVSYVIGLINYSIIDVTSLIRLAKFTFFLTYLIIPFLISDYVNEKDLIRVLHFQFIFFCCAGIYVLFNMITAPLPVHEYIWGYDNRYRLIGLTGFSLSLDGLKILPSTTSVSMGVFVAYVFLIYFSLYQKINKIKYLVILITLTIFESLTFSRAGLIVMVVGIGYFYITHGKLSFYIKSIMFIIILLPILIYYNLFDFLQGFGTFSKIFKVESSGDSSINTRIEMLSAGLEFMIKNPAKLLFGNGYGELYTTEAINFLHLEGLVPTILFSCGIFGVCSLILHIYVLWRFSKIKDIHLSSYYYLLQGTKLFIPGWLLSFTLSGNTFQTDFYFPIIYFILIVCYKKIKVSIPN